jgi:mRNA interferase MazF
MMAVMQEDKKVLNMVRRGEVWLADLSQGALGSEQGGIRPVVIVSNDKNNMYSGTITIVPLTSKQNKNKIPTHVMIDEMYLSEVSIALVEQVRTIDKVRLIKIMGKTSGYIMIEIDEALKIQNGLKQTFSLDKAFEMLKQINNIKMTINKVGKMQTLLDVYIYQIKEFKEYCEDHQMNYKIIIQKYNCNHNLTEVM